MVVRLWFLALIICLSSSSWAQVKDSTKKELPQIPDSAFKDMGVAVSPSSMHLSIKPGTSVIKEIKVTNDTKRAYKFQIGFSDFEMGTNGKPLSFRAGGEGKYSLSKWTVATPTYFELKPGGSQKVTLTISIPDVDSAYISAWTIVTVDQVVERQSLDYEENDKTIAMGVIPSFGFGVYIYQNPPNVKVNNLEIQKFILSEKDGKKRLEMEVKNVGDGIGYCKSYAELTNTNNGQQQRIQVKQFTILPGYIRDFYYDLPADLSNGKYSAVGVIDFGSKVEIKAAELEFNIP